MRCVSRRAVIFLCCFTFFVCIIVLIVQEIGEYKTLLKRFQALRECTNEKTKDNLIKASQLGTTNTSAATSTPPPPLPPLKKKIRKNHTTPLLTRSLECMPDVYLVIMVTSHAWTGHQRRATIRETWGKYTEKRSGGKQNQVWQTFFVVGSRPSKRERKDPYVVKAKKALLRSEIALQKDIVEGDFEETFDNLGVKLQVGFEWSHLYCAPKFIMKTDDDCFVNTKTLFPILNNLDTTNVYTGNIHWHTRPSRGGKYKVTMQQYNKTVYPPFASGGTMTFTPDVIARLVAIMPKGRMFRLEDVYIGLLIDKLKIKARNIMKTKTTLWDIWRFGEKAHVCQWAPTAIVRAIYFNGADKRWCIHKMYYET